MKKVAVVAALILISIPVCGDTAAELLEAAGLWGDTEKAIMEITLDIETNRGSKTRSLQVYFDNRNNQSKLFAKVTSPAFLSKMKYLYTRSENGSESKWVATSRGTRRLSGADRSEKLFDSDFTSDDLSKLNTDDFVLTIASETDDETIIQAEPKSRNGETRRITISHASDLITSVEFLDSSKTAVRRYQVESTRTVNEIETVSVCSMTDIAAGTRTMLTVDSLDLDSNIPARIFNRASL